MNHTKFFPAGFLLLLASMSTTAVYPDTMTSTSYRIGWDVVDGGGDTMMSASFTLIDSVAQSSPIGLSGSTGFVVNGGFHVLRDSDGDGVMDFFDNCTFDINASQLDADGDGYGNACDADLTGDCIVNVSDLGAFRLVFFSNDAAADFNDDGIVNVLDLGILRILFFAPPGPSAFGDCGAS